MVLSTKPGATGSVWGGGEYGAELTLGPGADERRGSYVVVQRRTHLMLEALQAVVLDGKARLAELLGHVDLGHLRYQVLAHGLQLLLDGVVPLLGRHHEGNLPGRIAQCDVRLWHTRKIRVRQECELG